MSQTTLKKLQKFISFSFILKNFLEALQIKKKIKS